MAKAAKKPKAKVMVSPKGVFSYPHLGKPDTQFDAAGLYKVDLVLDPNDEANALFLNKIEEARIEATDAAKEELGKKKVKESDSPVQELDDDSGNVRVRFKMKASYVYNNETITQAPSGYDAKKNKIDLKTTSVWGGTVGKIAFTINPFYVAAVGAGISLRLKSVQIIELVTGGGDGGCFDEEDGYEGDNAGDEDFGDQEDTAKDTTPTDGDY